jgi:hypothetical protein
MNATSTTSSPIFLRQSQNMHEFYIVIEDPDGSYWEGSVIPGQLAKSLEARGVVSIPFEPSLSHVGNGGFAKRSWGAGYPLDYATPRMVAPLTLYCNKSFLKLTWRARIMPEEQLIERVREGERLDGMLRFASDTGAPTAQVATISSKENPLLIRQLPNLDDYDGWIIGGTAEVNVVQEGHYGFALYGMAPGVRVIWVAASTAA